MITSGQTSSRSVKVLPEAWVAAMKRAKSSSGSAESSSGAGAADAWSTAGTRETGLHAASRSTANSVMERRTACLCIVVSLIVAHASCAFHERRGCEAAIDNTGTWGCHARTRACRPTREGAGGKRTGCGRRRERTTSRRLTKGGCSLMFRSAPCSLCAFAPARPAIRRVMRRAKRSRRRQMLAPRPPAGATA